MTGYFSNTLYVSLTINSSLFLTKNAIKEKNILIFTQNEGNPPSTNGKGKPENCW